MKMFIQNYLRAFGALAFICLIAPSVSAETISHVVALELAQKETEVAAPALPTITQVQLVVTAPFSTAHLTIFSDGHMRYEVTSPQNDINENETKTILPEQFQVLAELIRTNHFDTLQANYADKILDASSFAVTVDYSSAQKESSPSSLTVNCQAAACPQEVNNIIASIKKMWGKEISEIVL